MSKIYKTWEAIKAISENSKLKFKRTDRSGTLISDGEFLEWQDGSYVTGIGLDYEWEEVKESVDFMTAVKAYSEGKVIYCIFVDEGEEYRDIFNPRCKKSDFGFELTQEQNYAIETGKILKGKWFIEEE